MRFLNNCVPLVLALFFVGGSVRADLIKNLAEEYHSPDSMKWQALTAEINDKQVVFVSLSDWFFVPLRAYSDNLRTVKGDLHLDATIVESRFFDSYDNNASRLALEFERVYAKNNKKLLVIGNPQAGPDSLYAVLKNPRLLNIVDRIILVQPAFGTPIVDMVLQGSASEQLTQVVWNYFGRNLEKFVTSNARSLINKAIAELGENERDELNRRLFFVRSSSTLFRVTPVPMILVPYLALRSKGPTDGISLTKDQKIDGLGTDLGVISADHWDLFASNPASNSSPKLRKAFTRALLREVLETKDFK